MTTVVNDQEVGAIRAVVADAETLQSDADGFAGLLTGDVAPDEAIISAHPVPPAAS